MLTSAPNSNALDGCYLVLYTFFKRVHIIILRTPPLAIVNMPRASRARAPARRFIAGKPFRSRPAVNTHCRREKKKRGLEVVSDGVDEGLGLCLMQMQVLCR